MLAAVPFAGQDFVNLAPDLVAELFDRVREYLGLRVRGVPPALQLISPAEGEPERDDFIEDIWVRALRKRVKTRPAGCPPGSKPLLSVVGVGEQSSLTPFCASRPARLRRAASRQPT